MKNEDLLSNASLSDIKRGYVEQEEFYLCLCCGHKVEKGIIYPEDGVLYEASRYIRVHLQQEHQSMFAYLIQLDKSTTGLSDVQRSLLELFAQGKSDADVQKEMGVGSTSTIRNHRFQLKEKERQAKLFLAIMELLREQERERGAAPRQTVVTERDRVIKKYFPDGALGSLTSFSMKESQKKIVLEEIAKRFHSGRMYSEKEVNEILEAVYPEDYGVLRRYLVDYGHLDRKPDGSQYWRTGEQKEERVVDRKTELKHLYKETKTEGGIFQIKNQVNHKVWIESTPNFKTINGQQFQLQMGSHRIKSLQEEYNEFGKDAFTFDILEVLEVKDNPFFDRKDALQKLKDKWLEQLQPFDERGYNDKKELE